MKFTTVLSTALLFASSAFADTVRVTYDQTYDNPGQSLATVACSNGLNGLLTRGFTNFSSLPSFPYIGGAPAVTGWNSTACGTCWNLAFNGTSINILAIDFSTGFNIALEAFNNLTDGNGVALGRIDAVSTQVPASVCGLD